MTLRRWAAPAAAILAVVAVGAVALLASRPSGLPARSFSSVPPLHSEPIGIPGEGLTLLPDGLGAVDFGADAESTIATLTKLLGEPVEDGPQPCSDEDDDVVRWVRWGDLTAAFPGDRFAGWIIGIFFPADASALRVTTAEGLALGAPASELLATYGDRVAFHATEHGGPDESVEGWGLDGFDPENPEPVGMGGYVEGGREEGRVITFLAGQPCG